MYETLKFPWGKLIEQYALKLITRKNSVIVHVK